MEPENLNDEEVTKSGKICNASLDEEFCGLCDTFLLSHEEYIQHLDSVTHLEMLVKSSFLSQQLYKVLNQIIEMFSNRKENCHCKENFSDNLTLFVDHLKCPNWIETSSVGCNTPHHVAEVVVGKDSAEEQSSNHAAKIQIIQSTQQDVYSNELSENSSAPKRSGKRNLTDKESTQCRARSRDPVRTSRLLSNATKTANRNLGTSANGDATNSAMMNYLITAANSYGKFSTRVIPPANNCVGWAMARSKGLWLASNEFGIKRSRDPLSRRPLIDHSTRTSNSREDMSSSTRTQNDPEEVSDFEDIYFERDFNPAEKTPQFDGTNLSDDLFSDFFSENIRSGDTCSFNKPCKRLRSDDGYGNNVFDRDCSFIIFQCYTCKALIAHNNLVAQHYLSCGASAAASNLSKNARSKDDISLCCLVCNGMVLKSHADMRTHLKLGVHSAAVSKLALEPRANVINAVAKMGLAGNLISVFKTTELKDVESLVSRIEEFRIYTNAAIEVVRLLIMFNNDIYHPTHIILPNELCQNKFIPELKFYFDRALKKFNESSILMKKCCGLFLCIICGTIASDIYNYLFHLFDLQHLVKSSFKLQPVCCMACENPHLVSDFTKLFESIQKVNPSTGEKYECITLNERERPCPAPSNENDSLSKFTSYLETAQLVSITTLDTNVTFKCRDSSCSDSSIINNLFQLFLHLTSRTHQPPGSEMKLHSCKIECSCCKGLFTSFTSLLVHCVVEAKVKSKVKVVIQID